MDADRKMIAKKGWQTCPSRRAVGLFAHNSYSAARDFWSISAAVAARAEGAAVKIVPKLIAMSP